ncbi:hypothetical protein CDD83_6472 [Cordyceps sp. RAO-2017]|nr:hypothetical protein CDD83_6472 [Cordyceps sp. RAO-2017]
MGWSLDSQIDEAVASGRVPTDVPPDVIEGLHESRDEDGIIGIIVVAAVAALVVTLRMLSRMFIVKRVGSDDVLALLSLVAFIPFVALAIRQIQLGGGRDYLFEELVMDEATQATLQTYDTVSHIAYITALTLCRLSGILFYYRICRLRHEFLIGLRFCFGIVVVAYLMQVSLIAFHSMPVSALWTPELAFVDEDDIVYFIQWGQVHIVISITSLLCDLLLFGIPVAMLRILKTMPKKQKVQLACILLPGIAVVGISITRLVFQIRVAFGDGTEHHPDFSFLFFLAVEAAEISATLIALSIPGLKPLLDKFILRKDNLADAAHSNDGNSRLRALRPVSDGSTLSIDKTGHYETEVSTFSKQDTMRNKIRVTTDVKVQDEKYQPWEPGYI